MEGVDALQIRNVADSQTHNVKAAAFVDVAVLQIQNARNTKTVATATIDVSLLIMCLTWTVMPFADRALTPLSFVRFHRSVATFPTQSVQVPLAAIAFGRVTWDVSTMVMIGTSAVVISRWQDAAVTYVKNVPEKGLLAAQLHHAAVDHATP